MAAAVQLATQMRERWQPKRILPQYERIADLLLGANIHMTNIEIAKELGYTKEWVGLVRNSDAFQAYYQMRRETLNEEIQNKISDRLLNIADKSLELVEEGIREQGAKMNVMDRVEVADKVLDRLGYGSAKTPSVNVNVNASTNNQFVAVDAGVLHEARSQLRAVEQMRLARSGHTIDARPASDTSDSPSGLTKSDRDTPSPVIDLLVE